MRYAVAGAAGDLVDALSAVTRRDYTCPTCGGAVFLRSGSVREAHFAHYEGAGSAACEDYHLGSFIAAPSVAPVAGERPDELPMVVEHDGSEWRVFLYLPEVPADELGETDLAQLRTAAIAIFAGDALLTTISGLDVRPGVDAARVPIAPSAIGYRTEATGQWPQHIDTVRWARTASPLVIDGMLFRSRFGEWTRLGASASVRWGEDLVLVASEQSTPPSVLDATPAGAVLSDRMRWRLWYFKLPATPAEAVEKWLRRLGYRAEPPTWDADILSVPASCVSSVESFYRDAPVIGVLSPPHGSSRTMLTTTSQGNSCAITIDARSTSSLYGTMDVGDPCEVELELVGEGSTALSFRAVEKPTLDEVNHALREIPRLTVRIGDCAFLAWEPNQRSTCPRRGDVSVDTGVSGARITVTISEGATRRQYGGMAPRDAERAISEALLRADSIEVDAGNFGCVAIRPRVQSTKEAPSKRRRLHAWLRFVALQSACTNSETGILHLDSGRVLRYRDGRLMSQARALIRAELRRNGARR